LVSRGTKSFVLQYRHRRVKIGRYGPWTVELARRRAMELIVASDRGQDIRRETALANLQDLTLAKGLADYIEDLKSAGRSSATISDVEADVMMHLDAWLKRPLVAITKIECRSRHKEITKNSGPYAANLVFRYFRAIYNAMRAIHELPSEAPTIGVAWNKSKRRQEPVADLVAWKATVDALDPIRRDYLHVCLFTGLRSEDCATIRWENIDFDQAILKRPCPKGGEERAFEVPLSAYTMEILRRRQAENVGRDKGFAFVTIFRDPKGAITKIMPLGTSARRWGRGKSQSPHRLRDTYTTACNEAGLSSFDIDTLTNHRPPGGGVTAGYVRQRLSHLRQCQEQVTALLQKQLGA